MHTSGLPGTVFWMARPRRPRRGSRIVRGLPWLAVNGAALVFASSFTPFAVRPLVVAAQGATGSLLAGTTLVAATAASRRRWALCAASLLVAGGVALDAGLGTASARRGRDRNASNTVRVVAANLLWENEQIGDAAAALLAEDPDVVITVETLDRFRDTLVEAFAGRLVPVAHRAGTGIPIVIWVRPELGAREGEHYTDAGLPSVLLPVPGRRELEIIGVHLESPTDAASVAKWRSQLTQLHLAAVRERPVVLAGDFNASVAHPLMRRVLSVAVDAARASGKWWTPTWPMLPSRSTALRSPVPVLDLDHVLVAHGVRVAGSSVARIPGSDHRGVVADVTL
jgi:endonuclease/exonuclease/phosphatase (EEP) superfamily protein YafD